MGPARAADTGKAAADLVSSACRPTAGAAASCCAPSAAGRIVARSRRAVRGRQTARIVPAATTVAAAVFVRRAGVSAPYCAQSTG